jgi:hypothetical protein
MSTAGSGDRTVRTTSLCAAAAAAGVAASKIGDKRIAAGGAFALGAAGVFLLPGRYMGPAVRGASEGLMCAGASQLGAQLGLKWASK